MEAGQHDDQHGGGVGEEHAGEDGSEIGSPSQQETAVGSNSPPPATTHWTHYRPGREVVEWCGQLVLAASGHHGGDAGRHSQQEPGASSQGCQSDWSR